MANRDIVVIGGSAGSGAVLRNLVEALPPDLAASVFVSTHTPSDGSGHLAALLAARSALPVLEAVDGAPIEPGRLYVARADRHLMIDGGLVRLGVGPRENMARPAIDPLFRSAALAHGSRVVGVLLSGMLNDGASGLFAIQQRGGVTIVQHPLDAEEDQMPLSALETVDIDHVAPARDLAGLIAAMVAEPAGPARLPSRGLELEVRVAMGAALNSTLLATVAEPTTLTCPDCEGVLSEVTGERPLRYRCQIGHAYTAEVLEDAGEKADEAIRVAMRIMEERVQLVTRMARDARDMGRTAVASLYEGRAVEYAHYAAILKEAAVASMGRTPGVAEAD